MELLLANMKLSKSSVMWESPCQLIPIPVVWGQTELILPFFLFSPFLIPSFNEDIKV